MFLIDDHCFHLLRCWVERRFLMGLQFASRNSYELIWQQMLKTINLSSLQWDLNNVHLSFSSKKDISMASRPLNRIGIFTRKLSHVNLMWWKGRIIIQCIEAEHSPSLWIRLRRPWITFQPVINPFGNLAWCCQIFGRQALMTRAFLLLLNWLHCCCDPHHHC